MVHVKCLDRESGVGSQSQRKVEIPCLGMGNETVGLAATMLGQWQRGSTKSYDSLSVFVSVLLLALYTGTEPASKDTRVRGERQGEIHKT